MATKIKGGGARKYDRNKIDCKIYRESNRREHNKLRRLKKHLVRHPGDACAKNAVDRCKKVCGIFG